jgi:hypothetical protein
MHVAMRLRHTILVLLLLCKFVCVFIFCRCLWPVTHSVDNCAARSVRIALCYPAQASPHIDSEMQQHTTTVLAALFRR